MRQSSGEGSTESDGSARPAKVMAIQNVELRRMQEESKRQSVAQSTQEERTRAFLERIRRDELWWSRHGRTVARVALVPLFVLAAAPLTLGVSALIAGSAEVNNTSAERNVEPVLYWLSLVEPFALATFFGYFFFRALRHAVRRSPGET